MAVTEPGEMRWVWSPTVYSKIWYFGVMEKLSFFLRLAPYIALLCGGIFSIIEVCFPSLRGSDFNRWEVDEDSGVSIKILGWQKMLAPPRVLAQGYVSGRVACAVALIVGAIFILIAVFGIRHVSGLPQFVPDLLDRP